MAIHRELFKDLMPAEDIKKKYDDFFRNAKQADGYYVIVQDIAERYGEKAYELAEQVFTEYGMTYEPTEMRKPGNVRRVGYAFDGINVYDIDIKPYVTGMEKDILWLYNREIRKISFDLLMTEEYFHKTILGNNRQNLEGLFVAYNKSGQRVGFIHCLEDECLTGSIEALFFLPGRIHTCVGQKLLIKAKEFFKAKNISKYNILSGCTNYPFYRLSGEALKKEFHHSLGHIFCLLNNTNT